MKKQLLSNKSWGTDLSMLVLRVVFGVSMFYLHGLSKWNKLFAGGEIKFADPFGIGATLSLGLSVFAEVICSILLILGLLTRLALVPLIVTMVVAVFIVHGNDSFSVQEKAILYLAAYLVIFIQGSGKYSLDGLLKN